MREVGVDKVLDRSRASLPDLVWNAAALEGTNYTLAEVKTLLGGVIVGDKSLEDAEQIIAPSKGYSLVNEFVCDGGFTLGKNISDRLHGLVARHEPPRVDISGAKAQ